MMGLVVLNKNCITRFPASSPILFSVTEITPALQLVLQYGTVTTFHTQNLNMGIFKSIDTNTL
jgi:hypothetical protein